MNNQVFIIVYQRFLHTNHTLTQLRNDNNAMFFYMERALSEGTRKIEIHYTTEDKLEDLLSSLESSELVTNYSPAKMISLVEKYKHLLHVLPEQM